MLFYLRDLSFPEWLIHQAAIQDRKASEYYLGDPEQCFTALSAALTYRKVRDEFIKRMKGKHYA